MALAALQRDPRYRVVALLTTLTHTFDRVAMHGIRRDVLVAQAQALGLPLVTMELGWPSSNEDYVAALGVSLRDAAARWPGLAHCAFGDLFLADVRAWREMQLATLGWQALFPLWGEDTRAAAERFITEGHRATLVCVDTTQLAAEFCGRAYDAELLAALPPSVDPCGEHGEFHTLVSGGPLFASNLELRRGKSVLRDGRFQYTDFELTENAAATS